MKMLRKLISVGVGCMLLSTLNTHATPYASGITNLSGNGVNNSSTLIQYRINEPCTNVYVLYYPGGVSNNLGVNGSYTPTPANGACVGVHTFPMFYKHVQYTSFAIFCSNPGTGAPHQISPVSGGTNFAGNGTNLGTNILMDFEGPRGVAVNNNPKLTLFWHHLRCQRQRRYGRHWAEHGKRPVCAER